jgi:hypothetical protein
MLNALAKRGGVAQAGDLGIRDGVEVGAAELEFELEI